MSKNERIFFIIGFLIFAIAITFVAETDYKIHTRVKQECEKLCFNELIEHQYQCAYDCFDWRIK